jgi:hypothetical protein
MRKDAVMLVGMSEQNDDSAANRPIVGQPVLAKVIEVGNDGKLRGTLRKSLVTEELR